MEKEPVASAGASVEMVVIPESQKGSVIEQILRLAIEKQTSLETLERLMVWAKESEAQRARLAFYAALAKFQAKCPIIDKSKQGGGQGSFTYNYAPLDAVVAQVRDALAECGFSYSISTKQHDGKVLTICRAFHVEGHFEESSFEIDMEKGGRMNDAQKAGSAMSYAKRYAFCNVYGIMTGDVDDDAGGAEPEKPQAEGGRAPIKEPAEKGNKAEDKKPEEVPQPIVKARQEIHDRFDVIKKTFSPKENGEMIAAALAAKDDPAKMKALMAVWNQDYQKRADVLDKIAGKAFDPKEGGQS